MKSHKLYYPLPNVEWKMQELISWELRCMPRKESLQCERSGYSKGHSCSSCKFGMINNLFFNFFYHHFHMIILPSCFCLCQISIYCFIIELQYNHIKLIHYITYKINHIPNLRSSECKQTLIGCRISHLKMKLNNLIITLANRVAK